MLIKFGIPVLAALALGFGIATTIILKPEQQLTDSPNPPANTSLGANTVAGLGELQTPGEQISIGTSLAGIVRQVAVTTGSTVKTGDILFAIDDRELTAQLATRPPSRGYPHRRPAPRPRPRRRRPSHRRPQHRLPRTRPKTRDLRRNQ